MKSKLLPPMRNVKMTLEFDGTNYFGWQSQAKGATVQDILENAIKKILGKRSPVLASGRTDSGVHVMAQVANVRGHFPMDDKNLLRALNSMVPDDIAVKKLETVPAEFNALKDAKWKKYRYNIYNSPIRSPLKNRTSWHIISPLDIKAMKKGAKFLLGRHDFASFMGSNSSIIGTTRNVISLDIVNKEDMVEIEITADGFLKQMVRNIVGTLVDIGRGRIQPPAMKEILEAKDRRKAGQTAPAHGLFMVEVGY